MQDPMQPVVETMNAVVRTGQSPDVERRPAHENLLMILDAVRHADGRLNDAEKSSLERKLAGTVAARFLDIMPDDVKQEMARAVIEASVAFTELANDILFAYAVSLVGRQTVDALIAEINAGVTDEDDQLVITDYPCSCGHCPTHLVLCTVGAKKAIEQGMTEEAAAMAEGHLVGIRALLGLD